MYLIGPQMISWWYWWISIQFVFYLFLKLSKKNNDSNTYLASLYNSIQKGFVAEQMHIQNLIVKQLINNVYLMT